MNYDFDELNERVKTANRIVLLFIIIFITILTLN